MAVEVSRRFRNGFFYQASYALAKNLGAIGEAPGNRSPFPADFYQTLITDRYNTRYDRGNLPGSRRQRFLLTGLFPLPWGKGRHFGNGWGAVPNLVAGGWELSTVTLLETGPYVTPILSPAFDRSNTGLGPRGGQVRPDQVGNGNLNERTRDRYWDAGAFTPAPVGSGRFGNAGAGILRGPGTIAMAAGLAKNFLVTERLRLRLEATFTNLPNHPNFLPPVNSINSPLFGKLTTAQTGENSGSRTGQVGVRLEF